MDYTLVEIAIQPAAGDSITLTQGFHQPTLIARGENGPTVYSENHKATTTSLGLVNNVIGKGTRANAAFPIINWGKSSFILKIYADGVLWATNQFFCVSYAMHAQIAERLSVPIMETAPLFSTSAAFRIKPSETTRSLGHRYTDFIAAMVKLIQDPKKHHRPAATANQRTLCEQRQAERTDRRPWATNRRDKANDNGISVIRLSERNHRQKD